MNNHLFDFSKQGYLNLLLAQHKKSKAPGDDMNMVRSRTDFLDKGAYKGVADFLLRVIGDTLFAQEASRGRRPLNVLDLACGEGYYTNIMKHALEKNTITQLTGIDISTPAIKHASKRNKDILWLISSIANIPLSPSSQDLVTGLFFHFDLQEVARVLKRNGIFITLNTGPNHLIELRSIIYDTLKEQKAISFNNIPNELEHQDAQNFKEQAHLSNSIDILNLLAMTPHYWRATKDKKLLLEQVSSLDITIDVQADIFIKT